MIRFLRVSVILLVISLIFAGLMPVQAQTDLDTAAIDAYVTRMLEVHGVPGAAIAIVQNNRLQYVKGYGIRNVDTGEPVTPETLFSIGSISKSFTAFAVMQLVEAGKLNLDTPVITYLPEFKLSTPEATQALTLRHLLSNSAGFVPDDVVWYTGKLQNNADLLAHIATLKIEAAPGTKFAYNNLGFALVGVVIEQVTGQTWAEYMRENVLPLFYMQTATLSYAEMQKSADFAAPHGLSVRDKYRRLPFFPHLDIVGAAGGIHASAREMANYAIFALGDGAFDDARLLTPESLAEMHTKQSEADGAGYGLGWVLSEIEGKRLVWHNGAIDGFASTLVTVPEDKFGVVVLLNGENADNPTLTDVMALGILHIGLQFEPLEDIYEAIKKQSGLDPEARAKRFAAARDYQPNIAEYEQYVGKYVSLFLDLTIVLEDGRLFADVVQSGLPYRMELFEFEPRSFVTDMRGASNSVFVFRVNDDGSINVLQDGTPIATKPKP